MQCVVTLVLKRSGRRQLVTACRLLSEEIADLRSTNVKFLIQGRCQNCFLDGYRFDLFNVSCFRPASFAGIGRVEKR